MSKYLKMFMVMTLGLMLSFALVGCGSSETADAPKGDAPAVEENMTKLEEIKAKGQLVLGTSADYPPYEFHKLIDGEDKIVGFDIDIAKKVAEGLGVELVIKDMKFDGLLGALKANKIDMVAAGMTPTDERKESVDFTQVYYDAHSTIIIRDEDKDKYKDVADFDGVKVGYQKGSIQEEIFNSQFTNSEAIGLNKLTDLIMSLKSGKIEGVIIAETVANSYVKVNTDLQFTGVDFGSEGGVAIAFEKGNEDLVKAVDEILTVLIEDGSIDNFVVEAMKLAEEE
ncbi:MAG: transporter substrate-binding domain-containing protein [Firmicutes bacterium]|jgi:polar amino acid transport system substrate-binding protein|nr:transporter substrate-binding domain-containing protein [Bacillota bacterium]